MNKICLFAVIVHKEEAKAYLNHPVLGSRLIEICNELLKLKSNDANQIFGNPDDKKIKIFYDLVFIFTKYKPGVSVGFTKVLSR